MGAAGAASRSQAPRTTAISSSCTCGASARRLGARGGAGGLPGPRALRGVRRRAAGDDRGDARELSAPRTAAGAAVFRLVRLRAGCRATRNRRTVSARTAAQRLEGAGSLREGGRLLLPAAACYPWLT